MISAIFDRSLWDLWPNASKTGISAAFRADPIRFKIGVTWQNPHRILHSYWIKMLLRSVFPACKHLLMSWTLAFSNGCWGGCIGILFYFADWQKRPANQEMLEAVESKYVVYQRSNPVLKTEYSFLVLQSMKHVGCLVITVAEVEATLGYMESESTWMKTFCEVGRPRPILMSVDVEFNLAKSYQPVAILMFTTALQKS